MHLVHVHRKFYMPTYNLACTNNNIHNQSGLNPFKKLSIRLLRQPCSGGNYKNNALWFMKIFIHYWLTGISTLANWNNNHLLSLTEILPAQCACMVEKLHAQMKSACTGACVYLGKSNTGWHAIYPKQLRDRSAVTANLKLHTGKYQLNSWKLEVMIEFCIRASPDN